MAVKPGYKQTEVGVIPDAWNAQPLGEVLIKGRLGGNYANQDMEAELPLMKMGNLARGCFDLSKVQFIGPGVTPEPLHQLVCGDVLFNTRNTLDLVGKVAIWRDELPVAYYNSNLMRLEFDPEKICSNEYANYALNTEGTISRLRGLATGTTSVAAIYTRDLLKLQIPVPPLSEQRAIAKALSDVDALLGALERLIAKKRDLKQAAMQQLLTGQTRLPGFHGEWEVKRLGDVLKFQVGCPFSSMFFNEKEQGVRLVKNRDLKSDDQIFHYSGKYDQSFLVSDGDVLIGMDGDFLPCRWSKGPALLNQRVGRVIPLAGLDLAFSFYYLLGPLKEIEFATASTTVKHLSHGDIEGIEKPLPSLPEQTAIAAVLSDMDAELAALEQRLAKTRALKQGMMQELLTGRTRLV